MNADVTRIFVFLDIAQPVWIRALSRGFIRGASAFIPARACAFVAGRESPVAYCSLE
jgi:hypothetical protein